jgi:DNA primase
VRFIDNHPEQRRVETLRDSKKKQSLIMTAGAIPDDRSFPWFLVVTEAPIDALSLSRAGTPAVATLGAGILPDWILNVLKFPAFVILATDNDEEGQKMAAKVQDQIQARMPAEHSLILPSGLWRSRSVVIRHPRTGKDWNEVLVKSGVEAVRHELESDPEYNLTDKV